jgi:hypothetical protein
MDFILADGQYAYETLELGNIPGTKVITPGDIGLPVEQRACVTSSRTSGLPSTHPVAVNISSWVGYSDTLAGFFVNNVMTPDNSVQPGDSGSPLIWLNGKLLAGLTFAGTQSGSGLHNSIDQVLEKGQLEYLAGPGPGQGKKYGPAAATARYIVSAEGTPNAEIILTLNNSDFLPGEAVICDGQLRDIDTKNGLPSRFLTWEDANIAMSPSETGSDVTDADGRFTIRFPAGIAGYHVLTVKFAGDP